MLLGSSEGNKSLAVKLSFGKQFDPCSSLSIETTLSLSATTGTADYHQSYLQNFLVGYHHKKHQSDSSEPNPDGTSLFSFLPSVKFALTSPTFCTALLSLNIFSKDKTINTDATIAKN